MIQLQRDWKQAKTAATTRLPATTAPNSEYY